MQLDQTHLVMRPRRMSEIGDMTLAMLRHHPQQALVDFGTGALLWAILDIAILAWIPIQEAQLGLTDEEAVLQIYRYLGWMTLLVILQTPLAGSLATLCLGRKIFEEAVTWRQAVREVWGHRSALVETILIKGLVLPAILVLLFRMGSPLSFFWDLLIPLLILMIQFFTRGMYPFVPELLLLEKCPTRKPRNSADQNVITIPQRLSHLHRGQSGENGGRFIIQGFVYLVLLVCFLFTLMAIRGVLILRWDFLNLPVLLVLFPLCLWIIASISVVVRLLFYLDTRLRLEGWDVELLIRAEVIRRYGGMQNQGSSRRESKEVKSISDLAGASAHDRSLSQASRTRQQNTSEAENQPGGRG